jgi:hypothetical protein
LEFSRAVETRQWVQRRFTWLWLGGQALSGAALALAPARLFAAIRPHFGNAAEKCALLLAVEQHVVVKAGEIDVGHGRLGLSTKLPETREQTLARNKDRTTADETEVLAEKCVCRGWQTKPTATGRT